MKFHCPACDQRIEASDEFAGSEQLCPQCSAKFNVPFLPEIADLQPQFSEPPTPQRSRFTHNAILSLRWVGVLPAAVGAYFLSQILFALASVIGNEIPDFIVQLWNSYVGVLAFIYAGVYTAPARRVGVAVVLSILICAVTLSICFIACALGTNSMGEKVWLCVCAAVSIGGAAHICLVVLADDKRRHLAGYKIFDA